MSEAGNGTPTVGMTQTYQVFTDEVRLLNVTLRADGLGSWDLPGQLVREYKLALAEMVRGQEAILSYLRTTDQPVPFGIDEVPAAAHGALVEATSVVGDRPIDDKLVKRIAQHLQVTFDPVGDYALWQIMCAVGFRLEMFAGDDLSLLHGHLSEVLLVDWTIASTPEEHIRVREEVQALYQTLMLDARQDDIPPMEYLRLLMSNGAYLDDDEGCGEDLEPTEEERPARIVPKRRAVKPTGKKRPNAQAS